LLLSANLSVQTKFMIHGVISRLEVHESNTVLNYTKLGKNVIKIGTGCSFLVWHEKNGNHVQIQIFGTKMNMRPIL